MSIMLLPTAHAAYCHDTQLAICFILFYFLDTCVVHTMRFFEYSKLCIAYYVWVVILIRTLRMPITYETLALLCGHCTVLLWSMYEPPRTFSQRKKQMFELMFSLTIHGHLYLYWSKQYVVEHSYPTTGIFVGSQQLCFDLSDAKYFS